MSDGSSDRLKEFRAQYPQSGRAGGVLAVVQLVLIVAGFAAVIFLLARVMSHTPSVAPTAGLPAEKQRALAVYLSEKNDGPAAIASYEEYLKTAQMEPKDRAKICFSVAKLAIDAEKYEQALPYLYQSEFLDPQGELKDEINKKVVLCLDKLKRNVDLRHELRQRTDVKKTAADVKDGERILAEVGTEVITNRDLEKEIDKLPQAVRDEFTKDEKKEELLKDLVAQRLLLEKARRLELDKSPEVQEQLTKQLDGMIVNKLITDEVQKDVKITPEDVDRFYKAELDRFKEPASAEVIMAKADTQDAAKAVTEFKEKAQAIHKGKPVAGAPTSLDASVVFSTDAGAVAGPVEADKQWYVFKVVSKKDERVPAFEEVKEQAGRMLQMQKEQEKFKSLIDETLQTKDVHLYPERIKEPETKK